MNLVPRSLLAVYRYSCRWVSEALAALQRPDLLSKSELRRRLDDVVPYVVNKIQSEAWLETRIAFRRFAGYIEVNSSIAERPSSNILHESGLRCTCHEFRSNPGQPCRHGRFALRMNIYFQAAVMKFSNTSYWKCVYTFLYAKMPPPLAFDIHDHFENDVKCMPPVLCIRRGRPKLQRHRKSFEEPRNSNQSHVCSGCQQSGHNVVTCRSAMTKSTEGGVTTMRAATSS